MAKLDSAYPHELDGKVKSFQIPNSTSFVNENSVCYTYYGKRDVVSTKPTLLMNLTSILVILLTQEN